MVVFGISREDERAWSHAVAGAVSGAATRCVCQPLDVLKIRFQLQVESVRAGCAQARYRGVAQACRAIVRQEGLGALWKGHLPAQLLSVVYGSTQFVVFEALTREAWRVAALQSEGARPGLHFVCGAAAGSAATIASFPADVVRTRLVAQGEPRLYKGVLHSFASIYRTEGMRGFFRGLVPALVQVGPHAGAQFAFYRLFSQLWSGLDSRPEGEAAGRARVLGSLVCGSLAGLCAKLVVYPLDLSKKRLQVQGFQHARAQFGKMFSCEGWLDCLRKVYQHEGPAALYKGMWPSALKAATTTALHFCIYEQVTMAEAGEECELQQLVPAEDDVRLAGRPGEVTPPVTSTVCKVTQTSPTSPVSNKVSSGTGSLRGVGSPSQGSVASRSAPRVAPALGPASAIVMATSPTAGSASGSQPTKFLYVNEKLSRGPSLMSDGSSRPAQGQGARLNPVAARLHNTKRDVTDVRRMEAALLHLLEDFHSGKLRAFGKDCSMEQMTAIREQQERLARLHFDLGAQQELFAPLSDEGLRADQENMRHLMDSLEQLSLSIERLHSFSSDSRDSSLLQD